MESRIEDSSNHRVCLAAVLSLHFHSLAGGGPARLPEGRIEGTHHVDPGQRQPREGLGQDFEDAHLWQLANIFFSNKIPATQGGGSISFFTFLGLEGHAEH